MKMVVLTAWNILCACSLIPVYAFNWSILILRYSYNTKTELQIYIYPTKKDSTQRYDRRSIMPRALHLQIRDLKRFSTKCMEMFRILDERVLLQRTDKTAYSTA